LPDLDFLLTPVPAASEVLVSLELAASNRSGTGGELTLFLPTWTPGSYLVREFSRHLSQVQAEDAASGAPLACSKTSKNRFAVRCSASTSRVRIRYRVYAHELTVRTADVTGEHAFWNHACLLLWPIGGDGLTARITVELPDGWDSACALQTTEPAGRASTGTHRVGLLAENMERAYDAPFLAGRLLRQRWESRGVEHEVVLDGVATVPVPEKLLGDLQRVVEALEGKVPVFANTGVTLDTVAGILALADGCVVGTHFKVDGVTWNAVDGDRVKRFMDRVNTLR
jgi:predicted metalloprotease with PDZ domain